MLAAGRLMLVNGLLDLGGHGVRLAAAEDALSISPRATLDLNTGRALVVGERIESFVGLGDQTAAWKACRLRVRDTGNSGLTFKPVLHADGNTYWLTAPGAGTLIMVQ